MTIKEIMKSSDDMLKIVRWFRKKLKEHNRKSEFDKYFDSSVSPKLQLGSGSNRLKGWLNTDSFGTSLYLDITEKFPFDENKFKLILCEHTIEHVSFNDAVSMLTECFRVMAPGGKIRISTPNLQTYTKLLLADDADSLSAIDLIYENWILTGFYEAKKYKPLDDTNRAAFVVNDVFRNYEHKFIYDLKTLSSLLSNVGFVKVEQMRSGESLTNEFNGVESHTSDHEIFLTLTIEAEKPY
jgi:SAM-dependent methyltransferase